MSHFPNEVVVTGREWKTKKRKYTFEEVKLSIETEGYKLLQSEYTNSKTKIKVCCSNGHEREIRFDNWLAGHRCPSCRNYKALSPKWKTARRDMEKRGYKIICEPEKNSAKVSLECSKGHIFNITIYNWLKGGRCPVCPRSERYNEKRFLNLTKCYRKK